MTHELPYYYETEAEWSGGVNASMRSPGLPTLDIAPPPEFEGREGFWSPEHLYVASVNACFVMTFLAVARFSKLDIAGFSSRAEGKLDKAAGAGFEITEILIRPTLILRHSEDLERAGRLLEKAKNNCLISKSIKTVVTLQPEIDFEMSDVFVA